MLLRTWNLFHGNAFPPERRAFLDDMIRLATRDDPAVLCVQEVPAWALRRFTAGEIAARPVLGVVPIPAALGRALTAPHHGVLRSAFAGQGNAIRLGSGLRVLERRALTLNPRRFRATAARELGLGVPTRLAWAKERRVAQLVRVEADVGRTLAVCNVHCSSLPDSRVADAELRRAASFALSAAAREDVVVLAGDFNVTLDESPMLRELASGEWGFSPAGPGIDHVLVRGTEASPERRWPDADRELGGTLLSDHAPVEVRLS